MRVPWQVALEKSNPWGQSEIVSLSKKLEACRSLSLEFVTDRYFAAEMLEVLRAFQWRMCEELGAALRAHHAYERKWASEEARALSNGVLQRAALRVIINPHVVDNPLLLGAPEASKTVGEVAAEAAADAGAVAAAAAAAAAEHHGLYMWKEGAWNAEARRLLGGATEAVAANLTAAKAKAANAVPGAAILGKMMGAKVNGVEDASPEWIDRVQRMLVEALPRACPGLDPPSTSYATFLLHAAQSMSPAKKQESRESRALHMTERRVSSTVAEESMKGFNRKAGNASIQTGGNKIDQDAADRV